MLAIVFSLGESELGGRLRGYPERFLNRLQ